MRFLDLGLCRASVRARHSLLHRDLESFRLMLQHGIQFPIRILNTEFELRRFTQLNRPHQGNGFLVTARSSAVFKPPSPIHRAPQQGQKLTRND
jgi:hypothetical protein